MRDAIATRAAPSAEELHRIFAGLGLFTRSARLLPVLQQIWKVALVSDAPVLVEGETGTGKMVVAEAIHRLDPKRAQRAFVTAPCGTIPASVAESELFGHARGAFSGAVDERRGLFRSAEGGTIFLDDVSDLPVALQPKLLDVLQRRTTRPVGADREQPLDVRVIAASHTPLRELVDRGAFRADLYYRLDVIRVRLPPLRERDEDLSGLVLWLAARHADVYGPITAVEPALAARLATSSFPGNVRELEHLVARMLFGKSSGTTLGLDDLPDARDAAAPLVPSDGTVSSAWAAICDGSLGFGDAVRRFERDLLGRALTTASTRRELAVRLRMSERSLYKKLRQLRLPPRAESRERG